MNMKTYPYMFEQEPDIRMKPDRPKDTHYITSTTHMNPPGRIFSSSRFSLKWLNKTDVKTHLKFDKRFNTDLELPLNTECMFDQDFNFGVSCYILV